MVGPNGESARQMKADGFNQVSYNPQTKKYDLSGDKGGPGNPSILDSTDAWATSGTTPWTKTYDPVKTPKEKIDNFDDTLKLLGSGNIDDVTQKYMDALEKVKKDGGVKIPTIGEGKDARQIQYVADKYGTEGWAIRGPDDAAGNRTFIYSEKAEQLGADYLASKAEVRHMQAFLENASASLSDDARNKITQQEMARLEDSIGDENRKANQENTLATIKAQGNVQSGLQDDAQQASVDAAKLVADAKLEETRLGREFTTDEREAYQAYQDIVRTGEYGTQAFTISEREAGEAITQYENDLNRKLTTSEREAVNAFQLLENEKTRSAARTNQENQQAFAADENRRTEKFNIRRDELRFEQESKLESARTGIADATSEEGIARAVELANEARSLERTMAMIDVIEQISASGLGRQLSESGLLEQLGDQFGVDMSFLLSGGLSTGGGGGAPVRVTA
jgi:hypothetical protein